MCYLKLLAELQNYENCVQFPQSLINPCFFKKCLFSISDKSLKAEKDLDLWTEIQIYLFLHSIHSHMYFTFILKK